MSLYTLFVITPTPIFQSTSIANIDLKAIFRHETYVYFHYYLRTIGFKFRFVTKLWSYQRYEKGFLSKQKLTQVADVISEKQL